MARPAVAVSLAGLSLVTAACGGSKSKSTTGETTTGKSAAAAVQEAARKTIQAGSEHVVLTAGSKAGGQNVTIRGAGDFDSRQSRGTLHATISVGGVQAPLDEVLDGTTAYAGSPMLKAFLPAGKSWLRIDLGTVGRALGIDTSMLRAQDPGFALAQLKALRGLHEVGTATVGGVQATRYRGTIDVSKLPQGSAGALEQTGMTLGPVDVWVGADGYVRRQRVTTTTTTSGQSAETVVTTTLSQFGKQVQVSIPAASETVDASKVSIPGFGS